jgi:hypothetical protein
MGAESQKNRQTEKGDEEMGSLQVTQLPLYAVQFRGIIVIRLRDISFTGKSTKNKKVGEKGPSAEAVSKIIEDLKRQESQ